LDKYEVEVRPLFHERPSALKGAMILSVLAHIIAGLLIFLLIPVEKKEGAAPFVTSLVRPEEIEGRGPPRGTPVKPSPQPVRPSPAPQRQSMPQKLKPSIPAAPKMRPGQQRAAVPVLPKDISGQGIEKGGGPVGSSRATPAPAVPEAGGGLGGTQKEGMARLQPSGRPQGPVGMPAAPSLRERLFDKEVVGNIAKKEDIGRDNTLTFDTRDFKYYSYMLKLKERIESVWNYPADAAARGISGDLYIRFTIRKNGSLEEAELMRTSGHRDLDDAAKQALRNAQPYWPLPDEWGKDSLTITGHFVYSIYGTFIR
jgi:periplasmic protein TonB